MASTFVRLPLIRNMPCSLRNVSKDEILEVKITSHRKGKEECNICTRLEYYSHFLQKLFSEHEIGYISHAVTESLWTRLFLVFPGLYFHLWVFLQSCKYHFISFLSCLEYFLNKNIEYI